MGATMSYQFIRVLDPTVRGPNKKEEIFNERIICLEKLEGGVKSFGTKSQVLPGKNGTPPLTVPCHMSECNNYICKNLNIWICIGHEYLFEWMSFFNISVCILFIWINRIFTCQKNMLDCFPYSSFPILVMFWKHYSKNNRKIHSQINCKHCLNSNFNSCLKTWYWMKEILVWEGGHTNDGRILRALIVVTALFSFDQAMWLTQKRKWKGVTISDNLGCPFLP